MGLARGPARQEAECRLPVAEGPAGSHQKDRQERARADGMMGTRGQRKNDRGVEQDAQTPVRLSGGTVLMNQNRASGGGAGRGGCKDSSRRGVAWRRHRIGVARGAIGQECPGPRRGLGWRYSKATSIWTELEVWEG